MPRRQVSRVTGFKEMEKVLKELPPTLARKQLRQAVRAGATAVRRNVKSAAPTGAGTEHPTYGRLKDNIRITLNRRSRAPVHYWVHTDRAFWGMFIEFGTRYIAAKPWFRPAFEQAQAAAISRIADRLRKGLVKEARALAGRYRSLSKQQRRALGGR